MHHVIHPSASPAVVELHDKVLDALRQKFGEAIERSSIDYDFPAFVVSVSAVHEVLSYLRSDEQFRFRFLTTLCGLHFPGQAGQELGVMYQLHNLESNWRIRIKTFVSEKNPDVPTVTDLWATANWMERQEYDFFGIRFKGHPNLKRILNMDEMNYHPMRKEYGLEDAGRDDKKDEYFGR